MKQRAMMLGAILVSAAVGAMAAQAPAGARGGGQPGGARGPSAGLALTTTAFPDGGACL